LLNETTAVLKSYDKASKMEARVSKKVLFRLLC